MYEVDAAFSYLIPRRKQFSLAVVGLISIFIIQVITWLTLVFFSTTEGIEARWSEKIIGVMGLMQVTPTQHYFSSPYAQIDVHLPETHFQRARFSRRWQKERLHSSDLSLLPPSLFEWYQQHAQSIYPIRAVTEQLDARDIPWRLFETTISHLRFDRLGASSHGTLQLYSSVLGVDHLSRYFPVVSELTANELLAMIEDAKEEENRALISSYLQSVDAVEVIFYSQPPIAGGAFIPVNEPMWATFTYDQGHAYMLFASGEEKIRYSASLPCSILQVRMRSPTALLVQEQKEFMMRYHPILGYPILLSKQLRKQELQLLDRGVFESEGMGGESLTVPFYVAGFFDSGILPIGGKLAITARQAVVAIQPELSSDAFFNQSGLIIDGSPDRVYSEQRDIQRIVDRVAPSLFQVERYDQYTGTKNLYQQLMSERLLFRLLSLIIIIVACSNIFSMLFILGHDRRKEIAILRALGAEKRNITMIFSLVGLLIGAIGVFLGSFLAFYTLTYLPELLSLLGRIQGHEILQTEVYGEVVAQSLSRKTFLWTFLAVSVTSMFAGMLAAVRACKMNVSESLKES